MATIYPVRDFDPSADARNLRESYSDPILREKEIAYTLCNRSNAQRQEIKGAFQDLYDQDLIAFWQKDIKASPYLDTAIALMTSSVNYDAELINKAIKGLGTNEQLLLEVLLTRSFDELQVIKATYEKLYKKSLEKLIKSESSGDFQKFLSTLLTVRRSDDPVDLALAEQDATVLYKTGEGKLGTDEVAWNEILCSRSFPHILAIFDAYQAERKKPFEKVISKETSGDYEKALLFLASLVRNSADVNAEAFHKAINGKKTQNDLIRLIVSHCERDLLYIGMSFKNLYNKSLVDMLEEKLSGDFLMIMLTLV